MAAPQQLLKGRVTSEALAQAALEHPSNGQDRMSERPKVVFSTTPTDSSWDNSRITRDTIGEVTALKAAGGDPLRTFGSLTIVSALIAADLVDRQSASANLSRHETLRRTP